MQGKHFHTIEIMLVGGIGALILFNVIKMVAVHGIHRNDMVGDISRGAIALVK
jgi:hypothetical protein